MVHQNSPTVKLWCEKIEENLRKANTELSMDFRRANTEPSVQNCRNSWNGDVILMSFENRSLLKIGAWRGRNNIFTNRQSVTELNSEKAVVARNVFY